ncbi:MAG: phenylalanine--tRNA ligase subunit beta [Chloroflexi bacterium]|nr:phenylalanine--tRNA ligase subunit beta [Chloroflexota bacterium]
MKVPLSWLRELVDVTLPPDELVHRLNMSGTEVESVEQIGADWEQVSIATVVGLEPHPNADTLFVARLDAGPHGLVTIVTGATNLTVGAQVPWIRPGGRLPGGRTIEAADLRGIRSEGMVCSADELGLSPDRAGIYVLDEQYTNGTELRSLFGDTVLDLYITPNRPDCMSVEGIAREIHAITGAPFRPIVTRSPHGTVPSSDRLHVEDRDPDLCRRFTAAYVTDVSVGPSPLWLQRRLHLSGVRPISNVVDATNYTMLELGQPQHAFDVDALGDTIVTRRAQPGERLVTLDGVDRALDPNMLVIADAERAVSIAGIMGGGTTEVSERTRSVALETANFLPATIRRTSAALRLGSEASRRYERGVDPDLALRAAERTVELLTKIAGGTPPASIVDVYPTHLVPRRIDVDERDIGALLGHTYSRETVTSVLESLDFGIQSQDGRLRVTVPGFRPDVEGMADLAEEVARITGYDQIPMTLPTGVPPQPKVEPLRAAGDQAKDVLIACGLQEVKTYSLVGPGATARLRLDGVSAEEQPLLEGVRVPNAVSAELSVLRTELLPSLLDTVRTNLRHHDRVAIFEIARVYLPPLAPLPTERTRLSLVLTGPATPVAWNAPARDVDFYDVKGAIEELLARFNAPVAFVPVQSAIYHPGRCAELRLIGRNGIEAPVGRLGQIHPLIAERFDLAGRAVYAAELEFDALVAMGQGQGQIQPLPRFPGLDRDLALVLDRGTPHVDVETEIRAAAGDLLDEVRLFDRYEGPQVPADKKSLAYTLRFRAPGRTLTDEEADEAVARIVAALSANFDARVRGTEA